jgi:hypothetical protein
LCLLCAAQMVGMVSLLVASKMYSTGAQVKVVRVNARCSTLLKLRRFIGALFRNYIGMHFKCVC